MKCCKDTIELCLCEGRWFTNPDKLCLECQLSKSQLEKYLYEHINGIKL